MNEQIFGIFSTADAAEHAIAALKDHGVPDQDISAIHRADGVGAPDVEHAAGDALKLTATSSGDAVSGALKGGSAGLLLGVIGGALAITIPGIGPVLAAGPLWAAVSAALATTAAGAITGGTVGALVDQGVPQDVASRFHDAINQGDILVTVRSTRISETDAMTILQKYGAYQSEAHPVAVREVAPFETSETPVVVVPDTTIIGEAKDWPPAPTAARHVALSEDPLDEDETLEPVGGGAAVAV